MLLQEKTNYKSILYKTYFVLEYAVTHYDTRFVLKTDDDAFINVQPLLQQLKLLCQDPNCRNERIYMVRFHSPTHRMHGPVIIHVDLYTIGNVQHACSFSYHHLLMKMAVRAMQAVLSQPNLSNAWTAIPHSSLSVYHQEDRSECHARSDQDQTVIEFSARPPQEAFHALFCRFQDMTAFPSLLHGAFVRQRSAGEMSGWLAGENGEGE